MFSPANREVSRAVRQIFDSKISWSDSQYFRQARLLSKARKNSHLGPTFSTGRSREKRQPPNYAYGMSTNQYGKSDACGAQEQKSRGGPGSVVPESTQAGFCVFFGSGPGVKNL